MGSLQDLQSACQRFGEYPMTVITTRTREPTLLALQQQLDQRAHYLFGQREECLVSFWELRRLDEGYNLTRVVDHDTLSGHLESSILRHRPDPRRRFVFIQAAHSRDPLKMTCEMFQYTMTYLQVMPMFLELVFPFGRQHYIRDFHSSAFNAEARLSEAERGLRIQELNRSGRHIELCYALKSVERTRDVNPWSIRQCSVYHKLDLEFEQSTWLLVKGNSVLQDLIKTHTLKESACRPALAHGVDLALAESLHIHALLATWADENWQWYINDLESQFQELTRPLMTYKFQSAPLTLPPLTENEQPSARAATPLSTKMTPPRKLSRWTYSWSTAGRDSTQPCQEKPAVPQYPSPSLAVDEFSFRDLPKVQVIQEKATEISLVLTTNASIFDRLLLSYRQMSTSEQGSQTAVDLVEQALARFEEEIGNVRDRVAMQKTRVHVLLSLVNERKSLLNSVLQYQSMQASNDLARKAQVSTVNMEVMTKEMHEIARKTQDETVSMRIITLVTLFFLPGTFISTLMSTPIVDFASHDPGFSTQNIGYGALQLFVVISIPLMCLTFAAWYIVHWREERREKRKNAAISAIGQMV